MEMTSGLHGYLHFDDGKPAIVYDSTDPEEAAFVQRATRFYQIYDGDDRRAARAVGGDRAARPRPSRRAR